MTVPVTTTAGVKYVTQHPVPKARVSKINVTGHWIGHCYRCGWNTRSIMWYPAYHIIHAHMVTEHGKARV